MGNNEKFYTSHVDATIAISTSLSDAVNVGQGGVPGVPLSGFRLVGIVMPAAWTTANLTFQVSHDNVSFNNLYDRSGTEYVVAAAASRAIIIPPLDFYPFTYLKVRSGTSGTPVAQDAARTITLLLKQV